MIEININKNIENIILIGNMARAKNIFLELKSIGIDSIKMDFDRFININWQKKNIEKYHIIICHDKFSECIEYLDLISHENKDLLNICFSQFEFYSMLSQKLIINTQTKPDNIDPKNTILLTLPFGLVLGGIETWTANLYNKLKNEDLSLKIIDIKYSHPKFHYVGSEFFGISEQDIYHLNAKNGFFKNIMYILSLLSELSPKCIIENGSMEVLAALHIYKRYYNVNVIHIIHTDSEFMYAQCKWYTKIIDSFLCVSNDIYNQMSIRMNNRLKNCFVYIQYPDNPKYITKEQINEKIYIAYAARLERTIKRSYLLIELIEKLELIGMNYQLFIAGEGECLEEIKNFVNGKELFDKVIICGLLTYQKMRKFWQNKHVFINFSTKEGMSLSLLEAMSQGVVPIVTNTSGVSDVIIDHQNGFIRNNVSEMADVIYKLTKTPEYYNRMSREAYKTIQKGCIKNDGKI